MKTPPPTLAAPLLAAVLLLAVVPAAALHAQLPKIFVASFGNDANDGTRNSPKRNFQAAHDAVVVGGQIVVLDTAGYAALNITKSVSVVVPPGVNGFVTVGGANNGVTVNAGTSAVVALRGLIVEGGGTTFTGIGISVTSVGTLSVESCTVRNFFEGIYAIPTNPAQITIYDTTVRGCFYGLDMECNAAVSVIASATGCRLEGSGNSGVLAVPAVAGGTVDFTLDNCTVRNNTTGLNAQNAGAVLRASNCTITGNGTGVSVTTGGQVLSRANNTLEKNTGGNTFPGSYSAK